MKKIASLSLDLDNKWSYLQTHGDERWREFGTYLPTVVPRVLEFLKKRDIKITFFIVGRDATIEANKPHLLSIAQDGHEVGCHSFKHEPWLHFYSRAEIDAELAEAEQAIETATGAKTKGFRGPGYSISSDLLRVLQTRGYGYDCTSFPNILNPLARAYFFKRSKLSEEEKEKRGAIFGTSKEALRPLKPYEWDIDGKSLLEIPVTTMPLFRVPIHLSYLVYLRRYSRLLAHAYLRFAVTLCRITSTVPSILLHPLDFMGKEDVDDLDFFPGMDMPREKKLAFVSEVFDYLEKKFELVTMQQHADSIHAARRPLKKMVPVFDFEKSARSGETGA